MPAVLLLVTALTAPCAFATDPLFAVKSYKFCRDVVDNAPSRPYKEPIQIAKEEKLWIWLEISVNRDGYRFLRKLHKFPVYVTWGRDGWLTGRVIDIGITANQMEANKQGIQSKFDNSPDSTFTWRTHAVRENLIPGEYYVSILDANRRAVTNLNDTAAPCRPKIRLVTVKK